MGADKMDSVPYPALDAQDGNKVYLDLVWGDNSHDCITEARLSTEETPPGGRSARLTLGEFVSAAQSSGSSADDITYKDGKKPDSASYAFKLATISTCAEPFPEDGTPASFVNVRQFALGAVFCDLAKSEAQEGTQEDGNEGFRVKVEKNASGNVTAVKVRPGHVYFNGRFCTTALEAGADGWVTHSATSGDVWLVVQFDEWGAFEGASLATEQPSTATLTPFTLSEYRTGIRGQYAFHLATVAEDGTVKQYALGAVYCLFNGGTFFPPGPAE